MAGTGYPQVGDIINKGTISLLLEEVAESRFGHVYQLGDIPQLDRLFEVLLYVIADFGYAAAFGSAYRIFGVVLVADQDVAVGNGQFVQDIEELQYGMKSLHAGQSDNLILHRQLGLLGEADSPLRLEQ